MNQNQKLHRKIKMHFLNHRTTIFISIAGVILVILAIWGMSSLESYYRNITLATMPLQMVMVALNAIIFVYMYMVVLQGGFAKVDKKTIKANEVNVRFSDVIGLEEAKEEAWEVVQLITDHAKLKKIGGKILRGILMVGPPGCGKTYMAKAIATEAGLPFISMAASEFVEIFVGVGASRVRKLFKKARSLAYGFGGCIVFVDELDAMGKNRTFNQFGNTETNSTQNQLLVEMDGLGSREENIIIIGATNAPEESLDPALLRPGRFDRKVYIGLPSLDQREKIFDYYLKKVKHEAAIDTKHLARKAVGKSPADIENIVKEAALIATRNSKDLVSHREISDAIERIELGIKNRIKMMPRERELTAYHEAGHLVVTFLSHPRSDVFKASIIPRRSALGVVHPTPRDEWFTKDRETLIADIKVCLAGYAGEKIKYGTTSNGVSSDFQKAMAIAHDMVWRLGMGKNAMVGDFTVIPESQISEEMKNNLNRETQDIIQECLKETTGLLVKEKEIYERFAHELLIKSELEYDEIEAIFTEYGKPNPRLFSPENGESEGSTESKTEG